MSDRADYNVRPPTGYVEDLREELESRTGYAFYRQSDGSYSVYDAKWYMMFFDMRELSGEYPSITFTVRQVREDPLKGGISVHVFRGGKRVRHHVLGRGDWKWPE